MRMMDDTVATATASMALVAATVTDQSNALFSGDGVGALPFLSTLTNEGLLLCSTSPQLWSGLFVDTMYARNRRFENFT